MKRKIYNELVMWKEHNIEMPLMVIGARQVGKTYIIKEFCNNEFKKYVYINLFEEENIVELFTQKISIEEKIKMLKLIIKNSKNIDINFEDTVIFFDEIQESEELISCLKYFNESEIPYKIICAGSLLGVKLKRMQKAFPVGKVDILQMYSMDFEEFLLAILGKEAIELIKEHYESNIPMVDVMHEELLSLYRMYLCVGGMPASVKNIIEIDRDIVNYNKKINKNIISGYLNDMKKYVKDETETVRIENIYRSIPSQIGNVSRKFQYAKINSNARSKNYETAMQWLVSSKMVNKVCYINPSQLPPEAFKDELTFKLYISDVGLLNSMLGINFEDILLDKEFMYKGVITENYVSQQLNVNIENLYYWKSKNTAEIDFMIYNEYGIIPIEVKSGYRNQSKSLNLYINQFKPKYAIRISCKNFGFENGIKSVPLYAVFMIK